MSPAVDRDAVVVLGDEVLVAVVLHQSRDAVERRSQQIRFELVGARLADHRIFEPRRRLDEIEQRRPLRAERAAIGRMIRVALDMDDLGGLALLQVALRVHDDAARHRAIRTGVAGLGGIGELERADRFGVRRLDLAEAEGSRAPCPQRPAPAVPRNWRRESSKFIARYPPVDRAIAVAASDVLDRGNRSKPQSPNERFMVC